MQEQNFELSRTSFGPSKRDCTKAYRYFSLIYLLSILLVQVWRCHKNHKQTALTKLMPHRNCRLFVFFYSVSIKWWFCFCVTQMKLYYAAVGREYQIACLDVLLLRDVLCETSYRLNAVVVFVSKADYSLALPLRTERILLRWFMSSEQLFSAFMKIIFPKITDEHSNVAASAAPLLLYCRGVWVLPRNPIHPLFMCIDKVIVSERRQTSFPN